MTRSRTRNRGFAVRATNIIDAAGCTLEVPGKYITKDSVGRRERITITLKNESFRTGSLLTRQGGVKLVENDRIERQRSAPNVNFMLRQFGERAWTGGVIG